MRTRLPSIAAAIGMTVGLAGCAGETPVRALWASMAPGGPGRTGGTVFYVRAGSAGDGTKARPFGRLADALAVAAPGDTVRLFPGMYAEPLVSRRGGTRGAPVTITATAPSNRPVLSVPGRVATLAHPYLVVSDLVFDGEFGTSDAVRVTDGASGLHLRRVEIRRSSRDCVDIGAPVDVTIEDAHIHHCLNADGGRTDAHGIVAGAVQRLTIRRARVHTFSGDAIQVDPGRASPGWQDVRVEASRLWLEPLPAAVNGFAAGVVPGENGIDTKTPPDGARSRLTVVDTDAWGFRGGLINNMAAFNVKERVDATFDRVTVFRSTHAFRLRGPARDGARVLVRNAVIHSVDTAVRFEDDIDTIRLHHVTLGREVARAFRRVEAASTRLDVRHLLVLGPRLPEEAAGRGLAVAARAFADAEAHDYRLAPGSPAIDRATPLDGVTVDRRGVSRPQGQAPDVGAYEFCLPGCPPADRTFGPAASRDGGTGRDARGPDAR